MAVKRFLFVCGKNQLRSPTAEHIFAVYDDLDVLFAGTRADADVPVSDELVSWADKIFVMERRHKKQIQTQFRATLEETKIVSLDIPDDFAFMEGRLVDLLKQRMRPHIQ